MTTLTAAMRSDAFRTRQTTTQQIRRQLVAVPQCQLGVDGTYRRSPVACGRLGVNTNGCCNGEGQLMQKRARPHLPSVFFVSLALLFGCTNGKPSLLTVELCLNDDQGVSEFMNMMRAIAVAENLKFVDGGAETQRNLKTIGAKMDKLDTPGAVINIGLDRGDRNLMMGGNLGLPAYEVALGFSADPNPSEAQQFADIVVKRLSTRWQVETVPARTGALPMRTCPGKI